MTDEFAKWVQEYQNTSVHNSYIYTEFTRLTNTIPWLKFHRDTIEQNQWGFGDRAFHYLWYLILVDAAQRFESLECLEIGIYKGQVLSLWSLISKNIGIDLSVIGIGPLSGNLKTTIFSKILRKLRYLFDSKFRRHFDQQHAVGNILEHMDYLDIVEQVFSAFQLSRHPVQLLKGFSADPEIIEQVKGKSFHVIYIDGDHSFEGVRSDIHNYGPLVSKSGYLIMDDAAFFLPGQGYFKGHQSVSKACEDLLSLGFTNILNVGHNRVYRKL